MFLLQVQTRDGWFSLARYESLADAQPACDRVIKTEKHNSRVLENLDPPEEHDGVVVYEKFYNRSDDPEAYDDDDWDETYPEDDYGLRWQEVGF